MQNRSVSQRNVEIVRESFEAFGRGPTDRTVEQALAAVGRPPT
jgi:hypothetical protein